MLNFFLKRAIKRRLQDFRLMFYELNVLLETFEMNNYEYAIVGGFIKAILGEASKKNFTIRDIDILVDASTEELSYLLKHYFYHSKGVKVIKNSFGGFKLNVRSETELESSFEIDVWTLQSHYPFALNLFEENWKNVPNTAWISLDGATYVVNKNKLYCKALKKSLRKNKVYFTDSRIFTAEAPCKYILVAKLIKYWRQCNFELSEECWEFVIKFLRKNSNLSSLLKHLELIGSVFIDWENVIEVIKNEHQIESTSTYRESSESSKVLGKS